MLCANSDGQQCHYHPHNIVCARPETLPELSMLYVLVFIVFSDFMVRGDFADIDGIVDHHGLNLHFTITSHIESLNMKKDH